MTVPCPEHKRRSGPAVLALLVAEGDKFCRQGTLTPLAPEAPHDSPYAELAFTCTTWGERRRAQPDSDVFWGDAPQTAPPSLPYPGTISKKQNKLDIS